MSLLGSWGSAPAPAVDAVTPVEPDWDELKQSVHRRLLEVLGPTLYDAHLPEDELAAKVRSALQATLAASTADVTEAGRARVTSDVLDEILGLGPIQPFLLDPEVTEIMVNRFDEVYV